MSDDKKPNTPHEEKAENVLPVEPAEKRRTSQMQADDRAEKQVNPDG